MRARRGYRVVSLIGTIGITACAVLVSNVSVVQDLFTTYTPVFWRLEPMFLSGRELAAAVVLNAVLLAAVLWPLYKPRPRRILDTIFLTQKRVLVAVFALATLGYFNYSYRLPRITLAITGGILFVVLPLWFVWIRQRNASDPQRAVLIGDDPDQIEELAHDIALPYVGYLCPTHVEHELAESQKVLADGGMGMARLGELSRIDHVLVDYDIDTSVLAFAETDRGEFFGALDTCYEYGVDVKVHRRFADTVLTDGTGGEELVDVAIEPWDPQEYVVKRIFDVVFSGLGLIVLAPVIVLISISIKLDDGGPILYNQKRTAGFGESFDVHKFRTMTVADESPDPDADADRITSVGRILRMTHFDEIPQLWKILIGQMSVVGPRAVWVKEENLIVADLDEDAWRKRWFVKPGLTGLAQINDVDSSQAEAKLRYDLEYIREQSFMLDVKIVMRQLWNVVTDVAGVVMETEDDEPGVEDESRHTDVGDDDEAGRVGRNVSD